MTVWLFRNPPIVCLIVLISTSYILRWKVSTINNDLLIFVIFYFTYFSSYKKLSFNLVIAILVPLFWIIYSSYRLRFVHFFSVTFLIVLCFVSTHIQLMFKLVIIKCCCTTVTDEQEIWRPKICLTTPYSVCICPR